jgi:hypothetical protein
LARLPACGISALASSSTAALSYFFELVRMYNDEYVDLGGEDNPVPSSSA